MDFTQLENKVFIHYVLRMLTYTASCYTMLAEQHKGVSEVAINSIYQILKMEEKARIREILSDYVSCASNSFH